MNICVFYIPKYSPEKVVRVYMMILSDSASVCFEYWELFPLLLCLDYCSALGGLSISHQKMETEYWNFSVTVKSQSRGMGGKAHNLVCPINITEIKGRCWDTVLGKICFDHSALK